MEYVNISHRKIRHGLVSDFSSERDDIHSVHNILLDEGSWATKSDSSAPYEYAVIDYQEVTAINFIEILSSNSGKGILPSDFRIEGSIDGSNWMKIHAESKFEIEETSHIFHIPLIELRFLKLLIYKPEKNNNDICFEIGGLRSGITGIGTITPSSPSYPEHDIFKLFDNDSRTFWETNPKTKSDKEIVEIDLGRVFHITRLSFESGDMEFHGFPGELFIEISTDNNIWTPIIEEKTFHAERARMYYWDLLRSPTRYIRIEMGDVALKPKSYGVRMSRLEITAGTTTAQEDQNRLTIPPYASIFNAGIVRLADNGEDARGAAVQASDRRLHDATTIFKGIVQFASEGESTKDRAVQASDPRLKAATDIRQGIVRLAYDRENKAGSVVQGNDSRLKEATESNYGIVKLCPDGVFSELTVVTGNDSRLKKATTATTGIVRLADNGESSTDAVVVGSDHRLREATTLYKGIVELAEDGEDRAHVVVQGNDKRLKDATPASTGIVELAEDGENSPGVVVQGNDRRLKDASTTTKGIAELAEDGENSPGVVVQGNDRRLKDATISEKGISRLADNEEDAPGAVVQGNDNRLKDATEARKGILRFAKDGEVSGLAAVQGNDKRLRDATTNTAGIVELAEDGEESPEVAVQGNDRRLKDATTVSKGIVRLAEDGEDKTGVAVQGDDCRLKDATESHTGIFRFAADGEVSSLAAVQANDKRLRDATTTQKGIVQLAEDGEESRDRAVQGSDKRLRAASTSLPGIVELAENGEDSPGVVVQGNDSRLLQASEDRAGIVRLGKNGEVRPGQAVQSSDERLKDARNPLPHNHDYASKIHSFNSHSGTIKIIDNVSEAFSGILPPANGSSVIYAKNESSNKGAIGILGITQSSEENAAYTYGVVGHSQYVGVRGQSSGKADSIPRGCGVLGISRFGAGGVFASEHGYSLVIDGFGKITEYDDSSALMGDGKALQVSGNSEFIGAIHIRSSDKENNYPENLVELFEVDDADFVSPGDILIVSSEGNSILTKAKQEYSRSVIGTVSGNPGLLMSNGREGKQVFPVALAGKAICKVDARQCSIRPGDLIVTSDTPGAGMAGDINSFDRIGTVIGKALDGLEDGIGVIPIFIAHL